LPNENDMNRCAWPRFVTTATALIISVAIWSAVVVEVRAESAKTAIKAPKFEIDPYWPKPLPDHWVTGRIGGVCVDSHDHVFILNRQDLTEHELDAGVQAPPVIEFDPTGKMVNSWGDMNILPQGAMHGCAFDRDDNLWLGGAEDGIVQKYSHSGKLLLQLGKRGVVDSSDGTLKGKALNSSHTAFFRSSGIAFDSTNGDIYIADGEIVGSNHRIAVFDHNAQYLRQIEPHRAPEETGPAWPTVVSCVAVSNDGIVYLCDRAAHRLQIFDKMGNFQRNFPIPFEQRSQYTRHEPARWGYVAPGGLGTTASVNFSPDKAQKYMYVSNEDDEQVEVIDRANGQILEHLGRVGHQLGEFIHIHHIGVDSKGNLYVGQTTGGNRIQKFKFVGTP
jgi:hypothetical protein